MLYAPQAGTLALNVLSNQVQTIICTRGFLGPSAAGTLRSALSSSGSVEDKETIRCQTHYN